MNPNLFGKEIMTPSSVADLLQGHLERLGPILVEGEVASVYRAASGHVYFNLKDEISQIKAVMWRGQVARGGGHQLENGLRAQVRGTLSVYRARSEYQMIADLVSPRGEGALRLAFERLQRRLNDEGLLSPDRKRFPDLPPARVALLTAAGSAAATDFLTTALRRTRDLHVSLYPVPVQGAGAAEQMAGALADVNAWGLFDLIVLTRGGGSLEDLWAFNEEVLVRAVAGSRVPVLAAIGHSTDLSLVELAADLRAITPTAAAEAVWPLDSERRSRLARARAALDRSARGRLARQAEALAALGRRLDRLGQTFRQAAQTVDSLTLRLLVAVRARLARGRARLESLARVLPPLSPAGTLAAGGRRLSELSVRLEAAARGSLARKAAGAKEGAARLELVSPKGILRRGYAIVARPDGRVLTRAADAAEGSAVVVTLAEGRLGATVDKILDGRAP